MTIVAVVAVFGDDTMKFSWNWFHEKKIGEIDFTKKFCSPLWCTASAVSWGWYSFELIDDLVLYGDGSTMSKDLLCFGIIRRYVEMVIRVIFCLNPLQISEISSCLCVLYVVSGYKQWNWKTTGKDPPLLLLRYDT